MSSDLLSYKYPKNLSAVSLNGLDISTFPLLEVAIGRNAYGFVLVKAEIPTGLVKVQVDGQTRVHTYWGTIGFTEQLSVIVGETNMIMVTPAPFDQQLVLTNTFGQYVVVDGVQVNVGDPYTLTVPADKAIYAYCRYGVAQIDFTLATVSP